MAEIRSTMDMVMERAARMAAEAEEASTDETSANEGMRLAAAYLNSDGTNLLEQLKSKAPEEQMAVRGGMAQTLLRNIVLPRDEQISEQSLRSLTGLQELSGNSSDIATLCSELKQILEQYGQHREQVKQQFDESILNQLKMQLQQQGLAVDDEMALNPTMHPQYQEEWARSSAELNNQYNDALDQRKELIGQRFGI
ncbi:MAG: hypothetical protein KJO28_05480 [Desulfofustis sp.]|nr:hypothetical protein [Desulfofustis sp.]NNF47364.1 hypothetical protein [Desulfofustis sp.]NNK58658.1 hypothetical protein [Desulfofustis sp.]RZW21037.1 MAG: hypothetical protein EX260_06180 [Desulfobulbaceae bacterium]